MSAESLCMSVMRLPLAELNKMDQSSFVGFPFIICARLNNIEMILEGFSNRLDNHREKEVEIALGEISKIGRLRLADAIL